MDAGGHALGDDAAHTLERHALQDFGFWQGCGHCRRERRRCRRRCGWHCKGTLDVFAGDLAARTGAGHLAQVEAGFGGHLLGHRGGFGQRAEIGQHVAFGNADAFATGGSHVGQVYALLAGQLAGARRGEDPPIFLGLRRCCFGRGNRLWQGGRDLGLACLRLRLWLALQLKLIIFLTDDGDHGQHGHHVTLFVGADVQVAAGDGFDGEDGFVGLYLQDLVSV